MVSKKSPVQYRQKAAFFLEITTSLLLQKLMRMVYFSWLTYFCLFFFLLLTERNYAHAPLKMYPPFGLPKETMPRFLYPIYFLCVALTPTLISRVYMIDKPPLAALCTRTSFMCTKSATPAWLRV